MSLLIIFSIAGIRFDDNEMMVNAQCIPMIKMVVDGDRRTGTTPVDQLRSHIQKFSEPSSFNSCVNTSIHDPVPNSFGLYLVCVQITPDVIAPLVELLNQPLPNNCTGNDDNDDSRWERIYFYGCSLTRRVDYHHIQDDQRQCTPNEMFILLSTIARRTKNLSLCGNPEIVPLLASIPEVDHFDVNSLNILEDAALSSFEYARLGEMIQKSPHLQDLRLHLQFSEAPLEMLESLANAIQLQELHLQLTPPLILHRAPSILPVWVVPLLKNPLSRLQELHLSNMRLDDCDFIAIAQALPSSHLRYLNVDYNIIGSRGILEFAHQLPRILSLQTIYFRRNNWRRDPTEPKVDYEECCNALVHAMTANYSLENMDDLDMLWVKKMELQAFRNFPQASILIHYTTLNRAGRRILASSSGMPLGLWPLFLERAMKILTYEKCKYKHLAFELQANAVFFFLQHCPIILP